MIDEGPLVSVIVYNYNYGKYLRQCFDSLLAQTCKDIEILFSDNASEDDSWEIALEYQREYPNMFHVVRNRKNYGTEANLMNCHVAMKGKFYCVIGSDDVLHPEYVETCLRTMLDDDKVMYAMTHRYILTADGKTQQELPFYDGSYKLYPPSQNLVYMMAAINPSISQIMYRRTPKPYIRDIFNGQFYATRIADFMLCLKHPVTYINRALVGHRIHGENQSLVANENLLEIIGPYVLLHQFQELARPYEFDQVIKKYPDAVVNLSRLSLRYAYRAFNQDNEALFRRYFFLAQALHPEICEENMFKILAKLELKVTPEAVNEAKNCEQLNFSRTKSYAPSTPFTKLFV